MKIRILTICVVLLFQALPKDISAQYNKYPFIRYDLNQITLPEDSSNWLGFIAKFDSIKKSNSGELNIVHIGDSHIQGDYFTGEVRNLLSDYLHLENNARGMVFPYAVAGTNGPDEIFSQSQGCIERGNIRKDSNTYQPLSGYRISTFDTSCTIILKDTSRYRFNKVCILHSPISGQQLKVNTCKAVHEKMLNDSLQISEFEFNELKSELQLQIIQPSPGRKISVYGFYLLNGDNEVLYSSIGINGATFRTFLQMQGHHELLKFINPDCIIISYGTNEALNRNLDTSILKMQIIKCIEVIRNAVPGVPIILTTPGDYLINKKTENPRIMLVGKIIKDIAMENKCGYWDFFQIMGGPGSVKEWYQARLVFKDWLHLSKTGYRLQGDLFFAALIKMNDIK